MTEHEYWDELAAGYALHGLAPDEEIVFIDHLDGCAECAASVGDHEMVAAQLGSIAHYRESDDAVPSWESMRSLVVGTSAGDSTVVDLADRRRRYNTSRKFLAVAAAVAVVAGGGIAGWRLTTGGSNCSASAGCHTINLDAKGGNTEATVIVRDASVTVHPTGMAAAPAGKVYVLWQLRPDGQPLPIGKFSARPGSPASVGGLNVNYSDTSGFAVSVENANGPTPATPSNEPFEGAAT
jgi:anti-sigma-K factor RskA